MKFWTENLSLLSLITYLPCPSWRLFCFWQGKGVLFLRPLADVLPSAALFSVETGICNSLWFSLAGFLGQSLNSDGRKSSSESTCGWNGCSPVIWIVYFVFFMLATFSQAFYKMNNWNVTVSFSIILIKVIYWVLPKPKTMFHTIYSPLKLRHLDS